MTMNSTTKSTPGGMAQLKSWMRDAGQNIRETLTGSFTGKSLPPPETVLTLKLLYQGKILDTIRQGTDFTRAWFIGKGKRIFWQILGADPDFPSRHKLISLEGDEYHLQLPPGATPLTFTRNGVPVDVTYLIRKKLLVNGSDLLLSSDMSGSVEVNDQYQILYDYQKPLRKMLTDEEQRTVDVIREPALPDPRELANRKMIFSFLIFGLVFSLIFDMFLKPDVVKPAPLEDVLTEIAQRIEVDRIAGSPEVTGEEESLGDNPADRNQTPQAPTGRTGTGRAGTGSGTSPFGTAGRFVGNSSGYNPEFWDEFVTARAGTGIGSSGPGSGPGGVSGYSSSTGTGYPGTFDPYAVDSAPPAINKPFTGYTGGGSASQPERPAERYTGDVTRLEPLAPDRKPIPISAKDQPIILTFNSPEVNKLSEASIRGSAAGRVQDIDNVYDQVYPKRDQIAQAYRRSSAIRAQSGSVQVNMYIEASGKVVASITPNGSFTSSFLQEVKSIVENWRISVSKKTTYQFSIRLSQG